MPEWIYTAANSDIVILLTVRIAAAAITSNLVLPFTFFHAKLSVVFKEFKYYIDGHTGINTNKLLFYLELEKLQKTI